MKLTLFFAVLMSLALAGCGDKAREYDINVTNRTSSPVTIWLTQDHGPYDWPPPEIVAATNTETAYNGRRAIGADMTASTVIRGKASADNPLILRIYRATDLNSILAISRGSANRLDIPLLPGTTSLDVSMDQQRLVATQSAPPSGGLHRAGIGGAPATRPANAPVVRPSSPN